jgi:hypothetical protein
LITNEIVLSVRLDGRVHAIAKDSGLNENHEIGFGLLGAASSERFAEDRNATEIGHPLFTTGL